MKLKHLPFPKGKYKWCWGRGKGEMQREREIMANTRLNSLWLCFLIRGRLSGIRTDGKWATPHLAQTDLWATKPEQGGYPSDGDKKCPTLTLQETQVWCPCTITYCYNTALSYHVRSQQSRSLAVQYCRY